MTLRKDSEMITGVFSRPTLKPQQGANHIYLTTSSKLSFTKSKVRKLFEQGYNQVYLHALGNSIKNACRTALILESEFESLGVQLEVETCTVPIIQDTVNQENQEEDEATLKEVSAIRIIIKKKQTNV